MCSTSASDTVANMRRHSVGSFDPHCRHPKARRDEVSGAIESCFYNRLVTSPCGPAGDLFEIKPVPIPRLLLFVRWLRRKFL